MRPCNLHGACLQLFGQETLPLLGLIFTLPWLGLGLGRRIRGSRLGGSMFDMLRLLALFGLVVLVAIAIAIANHGGETAKVEQGFGRRAAVCVGDVLVCHQ